MGACYYIELKIKIKNEISVIEILQERIKRNTEQGVNYCLQNFRKNGIGTETLDDLFKIFLAGDRSSYEAERQENDVIYIQNGFDASYGWETEMIEMFKEIAPALENGSEFYIYPDNDYDLIVVENGKYKQIH